jgi:hypothetical protein
MPFLVDKNSWKLHMTIDLKSYIFLSLSSKLGFSLSHIKCDKNKYTGTFMFLRKSWEMYKTAGLESLLFFHPFF